MNDLVERLRNSYISHGLNYVQEAADEIESLRNRLHELSLSWQGQNAEIERLEKRLGQEKERADYAWKNTRTLDKVRMEAEAERDALKKDAAAPFIPLYTHPAQIPEGWQLVPKEPTEEMKDIGNITVTLNGNGRAVWKAMLAVAPKP